MEDSDRGEERKTRMGKERSGERKDVRQMWGRRRKRRGKEKKGGRGRERMREGMKRLGKRKEKHKPLYAKYNNPRILLVRVIVEFFFK